MIRRRTKPARFKDFIDGNIAPEYFEDEFLDFESVIMSNPLLRHAISNTKLEEAKTILKKFHQFESARR